MTNQPLATRDGTGAERAPALTPAIVAAGLGNLALLGLCVGLPCAGLVVGLAVLMAGGLGVALWVRDHADELLAVVGGSAEAAPPDAVARDLVASLVRRGVLGLVTLAWFLTASLAGLFGVTACVILICFLASADQPGVHMSAWLHPGTVLLFGLATAGEALLEEYLSSCRHVAEQQLNQPPSFVAARPFVVILEEDAAEALPAHEPLLLILAEQDGPQCQVCGTTIGGPHVRCERCLTPHHADCWDYAGGCSTYACKCRGHVRTAA